MINQGNIEEYLFDYFEGNLDTDQRQQVEAFVKEHPEYQADFEAWEGAKVPQEAFVYERMDELLKPEGRDGRAMFGRWKTSLMLLLLGVGMSAGVYSILTPKAKSRAVVASEESRGHSVPTASVVSPVGASTSDYIEDLEGISRAHVTATVDLLPDLQQSKVASSARKRSSEAQVNSKGETTSASQTTGVADGIPTASKGQSKVSTSGNQVHMDDLLSASNRKGIVNANTEESKLIASNLKGRVAVVELEIDKKVDLSSTPSLRKGRNSLEKYDKNVVKFQNNKDPYVNLPGGTAIEFNGALAGSVKGIRVNYLYNVQWPELTDYYHTHKVSVDGYVKALRGGVAVVAINDVMGHNKLSNSSLGVIYSPKFTLGTDLTFEPFAKYSYTRKSISWNQIKTQEVIDPRFGLMNAYVEEVPQNVAESKAQYSNAGVGFVLNTSKLYVGFSYDGLLRPTYDFGGNSEAIVVPAILTAHVGGSVVPFKNVENFVLAPAIYYVKMGGYDNLWITNVIEYAKIFIGTSVSINSDGFFSLGYKSDYLKVSYNYGRTTVPVNAGAHLSMHQLSASFILRPKK